jgi:hypothetical protein
VPVKLLFAHENSSSPAGSSGGMVPESENKPVRTQSSKWSVTMKKMTHQ